MSTPSTSDVLREFLDGAHLAPPGDLPEVAARAAEVVGWTARLYVADLEQRVLVPMPAPSVPAAQAVPIEGTLAGRAFQHVLPVPYPAAPGERRGLWLPLLDGVHRFGVVQLTMPAGTDLDATEVREQYRLLAHAVGHMLAAKSPYGDALGMHARRRERTVAAELLADLLPPLTFGCPGVLVSGILEPCYEVAADAFDYSVVDGVLHLAVVDATGHDFTGTLVAATVLAALRNGRRARRGLEATVRGVDELLRTQWKGELFATGVVMELELATGRLRYVNAGHPSPLLMRDGKVVKHLEAGRRIVLGLGGPEVEVAEEWLEEGDWAVMYTDGVTEARDASGEFYGLARLTDQLRKSASSGLAVPETLRRVVHELLDHQAGVLQDDATLLIAQWATGEEARMRADRDGPTAEDDPVA